MEPALQMQGLKAAMARVEARNELESYLYNARNSLQDEKVNEGLVEDGATGLKAVGTGPRLARCDGEASADEFKGEIEVV
jgi:hypothetical protein